MSDAVPDSTLQVDSADTPDGDAHAIESIALLRDTVASDSAAAAKPEEASRPGGGIVTAPTRNGGNRASLLRSESAYADSARRERTGKKTFFADQVCFCRLVGISTISYHHHLGLPYSSPATLFSLSSRFLNPRCSMHVSALRLSCLMRSRCARRYTPTSFTTPQR
jgi:hypothetical protein